MNVEIRSRCVTVTPGLRTRVERRARFALDRFADRVAHVTVRFSDANGPRGGEDKTCAVQLQLRSGATLRASDTAADLYVAIDRALHRAAQSLSRAVDRERRELLDLLAIASVAAR